MPVSTVDETPIHILYTERIQAWWGNLYVAIVI